MYWKTEKAIGESELLPPNAEEITETEYNEIMSSIVIPSEESEEEITNENA